MSDIKWFGTPEIPTLDVRKMQRDATEALCAEADLLMNRWHSEERIRKMNEDFLSRKLQERFELTKRLEDICKEQKKEKQKRRDELIREMVSKSLQTVFLENK